MKKKTYGAPRYMDWVAQIRAGAATVRVHFTGGALTVYGVTPAEYTTTNPFIQKVIEQSQYYKEGRITLIKTVELPDPQGSNPKAKPREERGEPREMPDNETTQAAEELTEVIEESGELTKVEASCLQDAQAYLQEHFNISSYKVRTYEAAQRAAAEHGVQFVGAKFAPIEDKGNATEEATEGTE